MAAFPSIPGSSPLARGLRVPHGLPRRRRGIIPARAGFTWARRATPFGSSDHPRSRGVYSDRHGGPGRRRGSSPLARGLRRNGEIYGDCGGIIPARAGFTDDGLVGRFLARDHPRSRGVYTGHAMSAQRVPGSSPLARGLLPGMGDELPPRRIIPARAGFTNGALPGRRGPTDHPRSRGVYRHQRF